MASNLINDQSNHHAPTANGEDLCERPGSKDFWDKMVWHCDPELAESVRVPVCSLRRSNHGKIERQSTSCRKSAVLYGFGRSKSPDRVLHVLCRTPLSVTLANLSSGTRALYQNAVKSTLSYSPFVRTPHYPAHGTLPPPRPVTCVNHPY